MGLIFDSKLRNSRRIEKKICYVMCKMSVYLEWYIEMNAFCNTERLEVIVKTKNMEWRLYYAK